MKALLFAAVAAVAGVSYVGYSYNSTDGKSCLVCPMTGEPVFTSSDSETGPCCAGSDIATLTSISGDGSSCCMKSGSGCCSQNDDAILTSADSSECPAGEHGCCKDKENAADLTAVQEEGTTEGTGDVVADNNGT